MISQPSNHLPAKGPAFSTLLCELGVMLLTVAAWSQSRGTLINDSWEPVVTVGLAGIFFGVVKNFYVLPAREKARASKRAYLAHLFKTSVLAVGCAVAAMAIVANVH